jgi:hypothetical protein
MNKKILAIITALLLAASLCACGDKQEEETTNNNKIDIPNGSDTQGTGDEESDASEESDETNDQNASAGEEDDHADQTYVDLSEAKTVYILHPNGAVKLHGTGEVKDTSLPNGSQVSMVAKSENGEWSKVVYNNTTYYVASACLTELQDLDAGFTPVERTLKVKVKSVNVRNTPSMDNHIIGYLYQDENVKVLAQNAEEGWLKVEFVPYGGGTAVGYVVANQEFFEGDVLVTEQATETTTEEATTTAAQ